jgi:hypothetical protein
VETFQIEGAPESPAYSPPFLISLRISWVTSNIHRRRYRLSVAKETVILIPTIRLLEKHGPVLLPEVRNVFPIIHMYEGSAFNPSGQAWCDRMDCLDCYRLMKIGEALV